MLNFKEIKEIIKLIDDSSIDEFTYESEGAKVQLKKLRLALISMLSITMLLKFKLCQSSQLLNL